MAEAVLICFSRGMNRKEFSALYGCQNNSEHVQQIGSVLILPTVTCRPVKERNKKIAEKLQPANQSSGSFVRSRRM